MTQQITQSFMQWVPASEELPPECHKVLATYKNKIGNRTVVLAERVTAMSVECECEYNCDCEYDEERGCAYMPEGWWEVVENHSEFQWLRINEKITHWMSLLNGINW